MRSGVIFYGSSTWFEIPMLDCVETEEPNE
jgi:hypothetical protein